ncbi:MAG: hypothetical protein HYT79_08810 [Elusimicrobia bacterium]|nr:hypothetical protein [Elusimicrobiota bacterium]
MRVNTVVKAVATAAVVFLCGPWRLTAQALPQGSEFEQAQDVFDGARWSGGPRRLRRDVRAMSDAEIDAEIDPIDQDCQRSLSDFMENREIASAARQRAWGELAGGVVSAAGGLTLMALPAFVGAGALVLFFVLGGTLCYLASRLLQSSAESFQEARVHQFLAEHKADNANALCREG